MPLNISKGNMYKWCDATWNAVKGKCPHACTYGYCRRTHYLPLRLDEKCFKDKLDKAEFIFVGSSTDMWAEQVPDAWIHRTLEYCRKYSTTHYLFQSKNPARFLNFLNELPPFTILGTTIESNIQYPVSFAPSVSDRYFAMCQLKGYNLHVSLEPIGDFDLDVIVRWIKDIKPSFVSIGADSKGHHLPEPSPDKLHSLIEALQGITEVKIKSNLGRLLK